MFDLDRGNASDAAFCEVREDVVEFGDEILVEQALALGKQFDYDGSVLTPKHRRALYKWSWAKHLKMLELRSPQYYGEKTQCLSVSETAWPGAVTFIEAERLKRSHFEPEDLIQRLRKLQPSHNFRLRKHRPPFMEWENSPLYENTYTIDTPEPDWLLHHRGGVADSRRRLGNRLADSIIHEINERWAEFTRDIEKTSTPDSHLLRDIGHSPGGTLFPRYLVKGLEALREEADDKGEKCYEEEYKLAEVKREEATNRWKERNPNKILADDPVAIYRHWPADLMDELDGIDREAIRCGRRKYIALLRETEEAMQELVIFWRDCGLITGQRTPPPSWWLASWWRKPEAKEPLLWPARLKERLDAIRTEFTFFSGKGEKLRLIEISRWKEAIINSGSEPTALDAALPQTLLDELDIVWRDGDCYEPEETEDKMIDKLSQWRKSMQSQAVWHGRLRPRTTPLTTDYQTIRWGRLRSLRGAIDASRARPKGIAKKYRREAPKKTRGAAAKSQTTRSPIQNADPSQLSSTEPHLNESSSQTIPDGVAKRRETKSLRRRPPRPANAPQRQGVRKTHSTNRVQTDGVVGAVRTVKRNQKHLSLLTPPRS